MSTASELAQELIDAILDFLHDDRESLLSSSLVARKWVPAPRYHLFRRIVLTNVISRQSRRTGRTTRGVETFISICESPLCSIVSSIQDVVLSILEYSPPVIPQVVDILGRAPIRKILFVDYTPSSQDPKSLSWIVPHFPHLQEFAYSARYRFFGDVFALVTSFPELRSLSLYSESDYLNTAAISQAKPPPILSHSVFTHLNILRLRLYAHQAEEFTSWLLTLGDQVRLETFHVVVFYDYHNGWGPVEVLNAFLRAQGRYLRHLNIEISYEDGDKEIEDELRLSKESHGDLDLSPLEKLQSLLLSNHNAADLCLALTTLPHPLPSLTSVEVHFQIWKYWHHMPCPCDPSVLVQDFADAMAGEQFSHLTRFHIRVPPFFSDEGREALRKYFPRWENTPDVLRVMFLDKERYPPDSLEDVRALIFL